MWGMTTPTPRDRAAQILTLEYLEPRMLAAHGLTRRQCATAVEDGRLIRVRRGRYLPSGYHPDVIRALRVGGRLDCVSLLSSIGIFVRDRGSLHVQVDMGSSRLPPRDRAIVAHWRKSCAGRTAVAGDLVEALAQACRCQSPRDAVATLDSAWHHGFVNDERIAEVFARLPRRFRRLLGLLDRRSESGPESLMRLMLRGLGCRVELQVSIDGVGRVDFVVDGWLIIECDSREFHEGWEAQKRDRRRDIAAAALGYTTIRPIAEDILGAPDHVLAELKRILARGPRA